VIDLGALDRGDQRPFSAKRGGKRRVRAHPEPMIGARFAPAVRWWIGDRSPPSQRRCGRSMVGGLWWSELPERFRVELAFFGR
jgi:hypothetical protein